MKMQSFCRVLGELLEAVRKLYFRKISGVKLTLKQVTTQKMKFSIKDFSSKCDQIRSFLEKHLLTFTGEILNEKLHFLCSDHRGVARI